MNQPVRAFLFVTFVAGILAGSLAVLEIAPNLPTCWTIEKWVEDHRGSLPANYDEFTAFPKSYRIRIFAALSPEGKSEIVRAILRRALTTPSLQAEHRETVSEAIEFFSEEYFRSEATERLQELKQLRARLKDAGLEDLLRHDPPTYASLASKGAFVRNWLRGLFAASADINCDCNIATEECNPGFECKTSQACTVVTGGCSLSDCDGQCKDYFDE